MNRCFVMCEQPPLRAIRLMHQNESLTGCWKKINLVFIYNFMMIKVNSNSD